MSGLCDIKFIRFYARTLSKMNKS